MTTAVGARQILAPGWSGGLRADIALVDGVCNVNRTYYALRDPCP